MDSCDLCGSTNGGIKLTCPNTMFRNVRILCWDHFHTVENIRMKHAHDAYRYGQKDWYERLCRNVKSEVKKLYRKFQRKK